jgi:PAS domain S-box-containing protein
MLQDSLQAGYWEWDMQGGIPFNTSLLLELGYTPEEITTTPPWAGKISEDDRIEFVINLRRNIESRNTGSFVQEVRFYNLKQHTQYFLFTGKIMEWVSATEPKMMRGSYLNITQQKEAEVETNRLRDFLDKTNEVAMVGGWELDMETDKVTWSSVTKMIFGVPPDFEPHRGSAATFFKEGKDRSALKKGFLEAVRDGKTYDLELRVINAQGQELWTRTIGQPEFKYGECVRVYGIFQDITRHKQDQENLKMKHEQLEKFIGSAPVSIAMFDSEMNYMAASQIWMASYHLDILTLIGKSHYEVFWEMPDQWKEFIQRCLKGEVIKMEEDSFIRRDGREEWLRWEIRPWYETRDAVGGVIMFTELITEKKRVREELVRAKEFAEDAAKAKSRFLSVMSHEIRTPMNAVIGFTNLLLRNPRQDQMEYLNPLKFSADNLMVIINDILSLSKAEEGMMTLEQAEFSLAELIQNIYATHKQFTDDKGIALKLNYDANTPAIVIGDQVRLGQIITNLVNNAIKFTYPGEVIIALKVLSHSAFSTEIQFAVTDTGIGIPEDKQEYVFEMFTQASSDTTREFGGTGLGLAICQRLTELMGGRITLQSKPKQGSTFSFNIEFKSGKPIQHVVKPAKQDLNDTLKGVKVLITEDNPLNVLLLKKFLDQWGVDSDVAENGEIALTMIKLKAYHLILMDLQMPVMDGYQTTREIRMLPGKHFSHLPIIALTASILADIKQDIINSGMNDCLSKPFNFNELYEKIRAIAAANPTAHHY